LTLAGRNDIIGYNQEDAMHRLFATGAMTVLLSMVVPFAPSAARLVDAGIGKSWGKAGVSLDQYRADAIACGHLAAATDLAGTAPAKALVVASRMIDNQFDSSQPSAGAAPAGTPTGGTAAAGALDGAGASPDVFRMIGPERQVAKAADILHAALDRCLAGRGYREFRLTSEQRHRLSKLPLGSDARRSYLHSLASDPEILARQAAD
jgi:hypothetical protein